MPRAAWCLWATACAPQATLIDDLAPSTSQPNLTPAGQVVGLDRRLIFDTATWAHTAHTFSAGGQLLSTWGWSEGGLTVLAPPVPDHDRRAVLQFRGVLEVRTLTGGLWASAPTGGASFTPAVDTDGRAYTDGGRRLLAVEADGRLAWELPIDGALATQPAIGRDGDVAVVWTTDDGAVSVTQVSAGGDEGWTAALGPTSGLPQLGRAEDLIVVALPDRDDPGRTQVSGVDADTGAVRWQTSLDAGVAAVLLDEDTSPILGLVVPEMVRLSPQNGEIVASATLDQDEAPGLPVLDRAGRVWYGCPSGLCALDRKLRPAGGIELSNTAVTAGLGFEAGVMATVTDEWLSMWRVRHLHPPQAGWPRVRGDMRGAGCEAGR